MENKVGVKGYMSLEADYLVVGCGAMGMAYTDILVTESEATIIMVDRRECPGGHWVDTYPFVKLHQPAVCYGDHLAVNFQFHVQYLIFFPLHAVST